MAAHQDNVHGMRERGLEAFYRWHYSELLVIIKSRLTCSQFYFTFVCKPSTDIAPSYCLHLECTAPISSASWARILSRNQCGVQAGIAAMPLLPRHPCWCTDPFTSMCTGSEVPSLPAASTCGSLEEGCPRASGLGFACIQEEMNPWGQILMRTCRYHARRGQLEVWSSSSPEPPARLNPMYFPRHVVLSPSLLVLSCVISSLLGVPSNKPLSHETLSWGPLWGERGQP